MDKADLEALEKGITSLSAYLGTADFKWLLVSIDGSEPVETIFVADTGVEQLGSIPGKDFTHEAYRVLRHIAWKYRAARSDSDLLRFNEAMSAVAGRLKRRPSVNPDDVDRVIECLIADRCGCDRCRYGV
jgi:hypothetical protein